MIQAINEKILAMDYSEFRAEIKTVDAQESLNGGVIVLVTGYLTGKDLVKKDFTQSFFLAPQDKGYFVLNDIFRYVDEGDHQMGNGDPVNGTVAPLSSEQGIVCTLQLLVDSFNFIVFNDNLRLFVLKCFFNEDSYQSVNELCDFIS